MRWKHSSRRSNGCSKYDSYIFVYIPRSALRIDFTLFALYIDMDVPMTVIQRLDAYETLQTNPVPYCSLLLYHRLCVATTLDSRCMIILAKIDRTPPLMFKPKVAEISVRFVRG